MMTRIKMNTETLTINGKTIRFLDNKKPGPVLLLSHGVGASLEFWESIITHQDNPFRMIAWDYPGHGLSDYLEDNNYRLNIFAEYAWQLLEHLSISNVTLVGNSLGCAVSLRMLQQQEQRVDKLVLLNAATLGKEAPLPFRLMNIPIFGEFMTKSVDMAFKQQVAAIFAKPYSLTDKLSEVIKRNVSREGAQSAFLANIRNFTSLAGQATKLVDESVNIVATTQKPILYIHGLDDSVIPSLHSVNAHKISPNSQLLLLDSCGHSPHVEKPQEVIKALSDFCLD